MKSDLQVHGDSYLCEILEDSNISRKNARPCAWLSVILRTRSPIDNSAPFPDNESRVPSPQNAALKFAVDFENGPRLSLWQLQKQRTWKTNSDRAAGPPARA